MIPQKVKDYLEEYINQEVYVQIAIIRGKDKGSTHSAINKYFDSNPLFDIKSAMFSDNSPFSRRFVESYKRSFSDYFVGKYSDKTGRECIDDLIKTWRSWDVFSITQFFLLRSRKFASRLTEDSHHTEFFRTLYRAIKPDPRERLSIDDIIDEIDYD